MGPGPIMKRRLGVVGRRRDRWGGGGGEVLGEGGAISNKMEKGSLYLRGNLIGRGGVTPQALQSQPFGINFASKAFASPAFQSLIH